jgi:hypothetical protein
MYIDSLVLIVYFFHLGNIERLLDFFATDAAFKGYCFSPKNIVLAVFGQVSAFEPINRLFLGRREMEHGRIFIQEIELAEDQVLRLGGALKQFFGIYLSAIFSHSDLISGQVGGEAIESLIHISYGFDYINLINIRDLL